AGARVLGNIEIGEGCMIGANAVVVRSVPAGKVVTGIPAKVVGDYRPGEALIRADAELAAGDDAEAKAQE
ncbi:MAG: hypothetical protein RL701_6088, partial [Pseudomonadota bacterium]